MHPEEAKVSYVQVTRLEVCSAKDAQPKDMCVSREGEIDSLAEFTTTPALED